MEYGIIVYSSTTTTNRAKRLSEKNVHSLRVFQLPSSVGIKGCNYSLRCEYQELALLKSISEEYSLNIKAIFKETTENGSKVYVQEMK